MTTALPVSRVVNVSVTLTPSGASSQSLSDLLVLGTSDVIDPVERYRTFSSLNEVAGVFETDSNEYLAAALWFGQSPKPLQLIIGRWFQTESSGGLRCAPLTATQQAIATWQAVTSGGFSVSIDGGASTSYLTFNFAAAQNMNAVAGIINTRLDSLAGANCVWDAELSRFAITSQTSGASSSISFLGAPSGGTDISEMMGGTINDNGAYIFDGMEPESALDAVIVMDDMLAQQWYALQIPDADDDDHLAVAAYINAASVKHVYGVTTQDTGVLVPSTDTDIASLLKEQNVRRVFAQYSGTNPNAVASALARMLTTNYNGSATVITEKFKQEPGVVAENLTVSQANSARSKNANIFVAYDNGVSIIEQGVMSDGTFFDIVTGTDWLALELQRTVFNLLYTSPTKVPQTEAGMQLLKTACASVCDQAVANGLLAPGVWNSAGFGSLNQGDLMPLGYYIYSAPISTQNQADRTARLAMPIQIAAKLAGAIHSADIAVSVNQ